MDARLIESLLEGGSLGKSVLVFQEVDSTNDIASDAAKAGNAHGLIVLAEKQRAGRGRFGRVWKTPEGGNIFMSVVLDASPLNQTPEALTLAVGLSVAEAVIEQTGLNALLKWPNDVWLEGRKLAGVLLEQKADAMIVGIGLNVSAAPPAAAVDRPATSLAEHTTPPPREHLVAAIVLHLSRWLKPIISGDFISLHDAWLARCGMLHDRVKITSGGKIYVGHIIDIHPAEGLHLIEDTGQHAMIPAAGASLEVLRSNCD